MSGLLGEVGAPTENLETSSLAAAVERPVGVDDHVPDLARRAVSPAVQAAVDDQAAADSGRPRDVDHVAGVTPRAVVELTQARHVGVVGEVNLGAGGAAEHRSQRHVFPWQVRRVDEDATLDIDRPGRSDCDAGHLLISAQALDLRCRPVDQALRRFEHGSFGLDARDQLSVRACQCHAHLCTT